MLIGHLSHCLALALAAVEPGGHGTAFSIPVEAQELQTSEDGHISRPCRTKGAC